MSALLLISVLTAICIVMICEGFLVVSAWLDRRSARKSFGSQMGRDE